MTALPERTVEAAACGAFWQDDIGGHIRGRWTWDTIPDVGRANYRAMVRAAFAAAMDPALGPDRLVVAGEHERSAFPSPAAMDAAAHAAYSAAGPARLKAATILEAACAADPVVRVAELPAIRAEGRDHVVAALREWIEERRIAVSPETVRGVWGQGYRLALGDLAALLDDLTTGGKTDGSA